MSPPKKTVCLDSTGDYQKTLFSLFFRLAFYPNQANGFYLASVLLSDSMRELNNLAKTRPCRMIEGVFGDVESQILKMSYAGDSIRPLFPLSRTGLRSQSSSWQLIVFHLGIKQIAKPATRILPSAGRFTPCTQIRSCSSGGRTNLGAQYTVLRMSTLT